MSVPADEIRGAILIADDEETFAASTAKLLERDGYRCDCAADGVEAAAKLRAGCYDVLIADVCMPGNHGLELVKTAQQLPRVTPVILVTGFPSLESAIPSVHLPVIAYLIKPVDLTQLQEQVRVSMEYSEVHRTITCVRRSLQACLEELGSIHGGKRGPGGFPPSTVEAALPGVLRALAACVSELARLRLLMAPEQGGASLCALADCPQWQVHRQTLGDTIDVLQKTKSTFKSKELGELRARLERLIKNPR